MFISILPGKMAKKYNKWINALLFGVHTRRNLPITNTRKHKHSETIIICMLLVVNNITRLISIHLQMLIALRAKKARKRAHQHSIRHPHGAQRTQNNCSHT